jgi:hypothetical protein
MAVEERGAVVVDLHRNCVLVSTRPNARDLEACNIVAIRCDPSMRFLEVGKLHLVEKVETVLTFEVEVVVQPVVAVPRPRHLNRYPIPALWESRLICHLSAVFTYLWAASVVVEC